MKKIIGNIQSRVLFSLIVLAGSGSLQSCETFAPIWFEDMEKSRQFCRKGDLTQSDKWMQKAYLDAKISEKGSPPNYFGMSPYSPSSFSGELATLAGYYQWRGNDDRAEVLFKEAFALAKGNDRFTYMEVLADFYMSKKNYKESEKLYQEILSHAEQTCSESKRDSLHSHLIALGDCYMAENKITQADALYSRDIEILQSFKPGPVSYNLVEAYIKAAKCCLKTGAMDKSRAYLNDAMLVSRNSLKGIGSSIIISNLADIEFSENQYVKAAALYQVALEKDEFSLAPEEKQITKKHYFKALKNQLRRGEELRTIRESLKSSKVESFDISRKGEVPERIY